MTELAGKVYVLEIGSDRDFGAPVRVAGSEFETNSTLFLGAGANIRTALSSARASSATALFGVGLNNISSSGTVL